MSVWSVTDLNMAAAAAIALRTAPVALFVGATFSSEMQDDVVVDSLPYPLNPYGWKAIELTTIKSEEKWYWGALDAGGELYLIRDEVGLVGYGGIDVHRNVKMITNQPTEITVRQDACTW